MSITSLEGHGVALQLAHVEVRTRDLDPMVDFYTRVLGFGITDRSRGRGAMVFLSCSPDEHHQIVLAETSEDVATGVDHFAFRVADLETLDHYRDRVDPETVESVSHGNSWSIYVCDPDGNRVEFFVDTPWHIAQPARWPIDPTVTSKQLRDDTLDRVRTHETFLDRSDWQADHERRLLDGNASPPRNQRPGGPVIADADVRDGGHGVQMSSHRTSEGLVVYYRQPTGRVIARIFRSCPSDRTRPRSPARDVL